MLLLLVMLLGAARPATAHDLSYSLVDVRLSPDRTVRLEIRCHVAALVMSAPQGHLPPDVLRVMQTLPDAAVQQRIDDARSALSRSISLRGDGVLAEPLALTLPSLPVLRADAAVPKSSPRPSAPIIALGRLAPDAETVDVALPPELGMVVMKVTHLDGSVTVQGLAAGEQSRPVRIARPDPLVDALHTLWRFTIIGFQHILPLGVDHILFIVALAVATPRLLSLLKLATLFTLAHSLTLALAALDVVEAPGWLVEPLIAFSIAAVAAWSLLGGEGGRWRAPLILVFGLLHGLGFAGALQEVGLPQGQEITALVGFNLGVEIGQLAVILLVLAAVGWAKGRDWYGARIAAPVSLVIAAVGAFWTVERVMAALSGGLA